MSAITEHSVDVIENMGEWHVRVSEGGREACTTFEREEFAKSYAEGQRVRLGLPTPPAR